VTNTGLIFGYINLYGASVRKSIVNTGEIHGTVSFGAAPGPYATMATSTAICCRSGTGTVTGWIQGSDTGDGVFIGGTVGSVILNAGDDRLRLIGDGAVVGTQNDMLFGIADAEIRVANVTGPTADDFVL